MKSGYSRKFGKKNTKTFDTITWSFSGGGDGIRSYASVSLGDPDPLTGRVIQDRSLFESYCLDLNRETDNRIRNRYPRTESKEIAAEKRKKEKEEIRSSFLREHGYDPDPDTLQYLYDQRYPAGEMQSLEYLAEMETAGTHHMDSIGAARLAVADEAMHPDLAAPDDVLALREYVSGLTPLQFEIYSAMLLKYEGGGFRITDAELSEKWGIPVHVIVYERKKIISGIRKTVAEGRE